MKDRTAIRTRRPRMASLVGKVVLFASLALHGCGGPQESIGGAGQGSIDLSSSEVHILGTSEAIAEVKDLEVLRDGSVWVLNSLEPFFLGFGPDGSLLATHGTLGGGPEEFGMPSAFVSGTIGGDAWVLDSRRHSLFRISRPDSARAEISLRLDSLPPGSVLTGLDMMDNVVRTARMGNEILLPRTTRPEGSDFLGFRMAMLGADIMALNPRTGSVRRVVSLAEKLGDLSAGFEMSEGGMPLWFRLWVVCGDERICVHDRVRNEIRSFDGAGVELEAMPLPPVAFSEVTPRQFAKAIFPLRMIEMVGNVWDDISPADSTRLMNEIIRGVRGTPEQLAQYLPRYVDFRCSDDGSMWLQLYDVETGALTGGPDWLRITTAGTTEEVRFPERFDPFRFTAERVWGVQRDELDVAQIGWIEAPTTDQGEF